MSTVPALAAFVGGSFRATSGDELTSINPSDPSDVVLRFGSGEPGLVDAAVDSAAAALPGWRAKSGAARAEVLYRWATKIAERNEELAQAVCREVGKPIAEARGEASRCEMILRYFAGEAVHACGEMIPAQIAGSLQFSLRQPLGVVGLITPWNFPLAIPIWKAAPALAFGNTVVLKPAEASTRVAGLLAETAAAASLPDGVFNVVPGLGGVMGRALAEHQQVAAVSFTGSVGVGRRIALAAAERNARFQTEMGGKNVAIVLEDADFDLAADLVASGAIRYAGQKCTATSRAVVQRACLEPFLELLKGRFEAHPLGPATDPTCAVGPVISREAQERIRATLEDAGHPAISIPIPVDLAKGFYVSPTVFRDVDPSSRLAREEVFGPVLAVIAVDDLDEAIAVANGVEYGLSASLFTSDVASALQYIDRIEAGMVRVNGDTTGVDPHAPFGGMKSSSSGSREQGPAAREFYTEIKTVQINPGKG